MSSKVRNKKHFAIKLGAIIFAGVMVVASLTIFLDPFHWFSKSENQIESILPPVTDENGNGLESGTVYPMPTNLRFASISAQSDNASEGVAINATVKPLNAKDTKVDWTIKFLNPNSEWANGKTVTDFVTITPVNDGSLTATVKCLEAFGEKIIIVVTSRKTTGAKAECTVDFYEQLIRPNMCYADKIRNTIINTWPFENDSVMFYDNNFNELPYIIMIDNFETTAYTIADTYMVTKFVAVLSTEFKAKLIEKGIEFNDELALDLGNEEFSGTCHGFTVDIFGFASAMDSVFLARITNIMKELNDTPIFRILCNISGQKKNYEFTYGMGVHADSISYLVEEIVLDNNVIEF